MSALTEQFAADVEAVEADLSVAFRFNGIEYIGQKTPVVVAAAMDDAGYAQKIDYDLVVRVNQFTGATPPVSAPKERDEIEIFDALENVWVSYRVGIPTRSQDDVTIQYAIHQLT